MILVYILYISNLIYIIYDKRTNVKKKAKNSLLYSKIVDD